LEFEYEGYFDKVFFLGRCHYYGYIHGKEKPEIKGVEIKRSSSSKYESYFQRELLERVLNKETREKIMDWINLEKKKIKTLPIMELAFPCKVQKRKYKYEPIFVRAANNSKRLFKDFDVRGIDLFWYLYVKNFGFDENGKEVNVIGITKKMNIDRNKINWQEMIRRSIILKAENVFDCLKWDKLKLFDNSQLSLF